MNTSSPLFAAGVDVDLVVRIFLLLLLVVIPVIGQVLAKIRQMQPPAAQPPAAPVPAQVADEIEEFMRRAAERRGTKTTAPAPAPPPKAPASEPVAAQVVTAQPVGGQVTDHVRKYLDEQEFRRRSEQLGEEVAQADRQIDQHLHQVFDHRVSKLEAVGGETARPPMAEELVEAPEAPAEATTMLSLGLLGLATSPESLRQAIILNEVLHRPEERWG